MVSLEYSQQQGTFHYNTTEFLSGDDWRIIDINQPMHKLTIFTDFICKKYPYAFNQGKENSLSLETVKEEYEVFNEWYEYYESHKLLQPFTA